MSWTASTPALPPSNSSGILALLTHLAVLSAVLSCTAGHCSLILQWSALSCHALQVILHTGDMRWQPRLAEHSALKACKVELLYMDTTYCLPKHVFPSQACAPLFVVTTACKLLVVSCHSAKFGFDWSMWQVEY